MKMSLVGLIREVILHSSEPSLNSIDTYGFRAVLIEKPELPRAGTGILLLGRAGLIITKDINNVGSIFDTQHRRRVTTTAPRLQRRHQFFQLLIISTAW